MEKIQEPQGPDKCQHTDCVCPLPETGNYCSPYCENAAKVNLGEGCQCGHADCTE